jgi:hypothetical protein
MEARFPIVAVIAVVVVVLVVLAMVTLYLTLRVTGWRRLGHFAGGAHERAEALLRELLTEAEYDQLRRCGYLEVRSPSRSTRTYRVPRGLGRVAVHEGDVEIEALCVMPVGWLPPGDIVLTHKLMIEGDEQEYLRRANHFRLWPIQWSI